jgi:hypothetical protein
MDVIIGPESPTFIDVNPRLVEPMNALLSAVDLTGAMLSLSQSRPPPSQPEGRASVRTMQLLLVVLEAARQARSRPTIAREFIKAVRLEGVYEGAIEELTPIHDDWLTADPVAAAPAGTLVRPSLGRRLSSHAANPYSLTPTAWEQLVNSVPNLSARPATGVCTSREPSSTIDRCPMAGTHEGRLSVELGVATPGGRSESAQPMYEPVLWHLEAEGGQARVPATDGAGRR